jgi:sugar phosphate isomerase/epimerase
MSLPVLKHYVNLWTLVHYPNGGADGEWSDDQKLAAVKAAGFDGFQSGARREWAELGAKHGLTYLGACDADGSNYRQRLADFAPWQPPLVNIQLCNHDTEPAEAARVWAGLVKAAADLGLEVDLEIHRDTCTETPEKTWRIADLYAQQTGEPLRFNFDLSHFALVKHLDPPYAARLLERPDLIRLSRQMHLRPFNGHHCEIPVTDGHGHVAHWARPWLEFVAAALACWREGKQAGETLWVCPELGSMTSGYWIAPFPDPWQDAIFARNQFAAIWRAADDAATRSVTL